ncbi:MAG: hypothetical protein R2827_15075 [Bdellovibrionales bacterium]
MPKTKSPDDETSKSEAWSLTYVMRWIDGELKLIQTIKGVLQRGEDSKNELVYHGPMTLSESMLVIEGTKSSW